MKGSDPDQQIGFGEGGRPYKFIVFFLMNLQFSLRVYMVFWTPHLLIKTLLYMINNMVSDHDDRKACGISCFFLTSGGAGFRPTPVGTSRVMRGRGSTPGVSSCEAALNRNRQLLETCRTQPTYNR